MTVARGCQPAVGALRTAHLPPRGLAVMLTTIIERLRATPETVRSLCAGLSSEDAHFKPPSGAWSIVEIVAHLVDEEREDFGARLRSVLEDPARVWPRTDPEGWARDRAYQAREVAPMVDEFEGERARTIAWLESLRGVDWTRAYQHPKVGPVPAGDLLAAWPAHDALHVRQIAKRLFELAGRDAAAGGFNVRYAGEWGP